MNEIITRYKTYLRGLIDDERLRRGYNIQEMIALMQGAATLPDFYRVPAERAASQISINESEIDPEAGLRAELEDAMKAVYGAWIREQYRNI
jgi:hypothetical protein